MCSNPCKLYFSSKVSFFYVLTVGEILRITHVARGLDSDGALLLDIVVNGHILQLPSNADISLKVDYPSLNS